MIKQKHLDTSREIRLWVTQVIIPVGIGTYLFVNSQTGKKCIAKTKAKIEKMKKEHAK